MSTEFTLPQLKLLHSLSDEEFDFPQRGHHVMMLERLERLGLVTGKLEPAVWDSRRGFTKWSRAYRRTKAGKIVCGKNPLNKEKDGR